MSFTINDAQDERLFRAYTDFRDTVRRVMGGGVYPKLREALAAYAALDEALATTLADPDLLAYHESLMVGIEPYTAQLRAAAENIVATMQAIEAAAPGTFDIPLP
jgi:hypothetical protein